MADVVREKKLQITTCTKCGYKTYRNIVQKGLGG